MNWTYYGLILVQTNEGILAKSGISQYAILEMNHWGERSGSTCGFLVFGHWYNINMYIHIPEVCMYIEWHGATNLFRYIYIYIYTHTKHVFCTFILKGPLKEKVNKKHGGTITRRYWDWHVGSDAGEFVALSSLVLGLRDGCMAWWNQGFLGASSRGGRNRIGGKKGFKNWTYGKVVSFFFLTKNLTVFFLKRERSFQKKGTSCMGILFLNGKLSEFLIDFERGGWWYHTRWPPPKLA